MSAYAPSLSSDRLDTLRRVELAEGVEIALPTAGPFVRSTAFLIDAVLVNIGGGIVVWVLALVGTLIGGSGIGQGLALLGAFVWYWGYFIFFEARHRGATPGKRIRGLRVVQTSGEPITVPQAFVRSLIFFFEGWMTFGVVGLVSMIMSRRFQRLGDLAAGTVVVYDEKALKPPVLASAHLEAVEASAPPLRLTREEQQALLSFAERATAWSPQRRAELAGLVPRLSGGQDERAVRRLLRHAAWLRDK